MIYENLTQLVGHTPLVELKNYGKSHNLNARILAKLEMFNPAGSAKDRIALNMVLDAEEKGILKPGSTIVEPTSGNTGIGLATVAAARGYKAVFTMPESMSVERRKLIAAYGAEIVLTPAGQGMQGAVDRAEELKKQIPWAVTLGQFVNPANPEAHYKTTGPEIWEDTEGKVDIFIAGVGTGGTVSGTGKYLKEQNPNVKVIAVQPATSPLLTEGRTGGHEIQGIGANFIPDTLDQNVYDEVISVPNEVTYPTAQALAAQEGYLVGISSGAALWAAGEVAKRTENAGKTIVVLLPDTGERYLSTKLFPEA